MLRDYYDDFDCEIQADEFCEKEFNLLDLFELDFYEDDEYPYNNEEVDFPF